MIYLTDTTIAQRVLVPRAGQGTPDKIVLISTVNKDTVLDTDISPVISEGYYSIVVTLPSGTQAGEYELRLMQGNDCLAKCVAMVGNITLTTEQYNFTTSYEQYGQN